MGVMSFFRRRVSSSPSNRGAAVELNGAADVAAMIPVGLMMDMRQVEPGQLEKAIEQRSGRLSETTPMGQKGEPVWTELSHEMASRGGYMASTWAFACQWRRMVSSGSVPWVVEDWTDGDWQQKEEDHPLWELVENPNEYWHFQDLVELVSMYLDGGGDCLLTVVRDNRGRPKMLWPISPDFFCPIAGRVNFVDGYRLLVDGVLQKELLSPDDVIHFRQPHPLNPWRGLSTIQAIARSIDTDVQAAKFQHASFKNQAVPSGAVMLNRPLTDTQLKDAERRLSEKFLGPENARKLFVFGNAASFARMSMTPQELDFLNSRGFGVTEIAAGYATPPPMVGWYEKATLSNIQESRKIYWLDNLTLWLGRIRRTLNQFVRRQYGRNIRLNYDLRQVDALISVRAENEKRARNLWEMGMPFNEANRAVGMGFRPIPGGNVAYIPATVVPEGMVSAGVTVGGNGLFPEEE